MWYNLEGKTPVPLEESQLPNFRRKHLGKFRFNKSLVSTVFLGLDHSFDGQTPILFETMIFSDLIVNDEYQVRYATYDEAILGHWRAVGYLIGLSIQPFFK